MKDILLIYSVIQLWANSIGLICIYVCKPIINEKIKSKGYVMASKRSLYNFNTTLINIVKFFIPLCYCIEGIMLVDRSGKFDSVIEDKILKGEIVSRNNINIFNESKKKKAPKIELAHNPIFEEHIAVPYKAKKNTMKLYDDEDDEPVIFKVNGIIDEHSLSPFSNNIHKNNNTDLDTLVKNPAIIVEAMNKLDKKSLEYLEDTLHNIKSVKYNT